MRGKQKTNRQERETGKIKDFVEGVDIKGVENPNNQISEGFILGDTNFVNWVKETFLPMKQGVSPFPKYNNSIAILTPSPSPILYPPQASVG